MNKAERHWVDAISQLGCCVCAMQGHENTPAEIHHMLCGGRRIDHLHSIPLCTGHHRNGDGKLKIGRHPTKARFEFEYGKEVELLEWTRRAVSSRGLWKKPE
jgi:hypothetical protein